MEKFFLSNRTKTENTGQIGISLSGRGLTFAYVNDAPDKKQLTQLRHCDGHREEQQSFLKESIASLNLHGMPATVVLQEQDYQVFLVEQPQVPDSEKHNALRWLIAEYIDFPIDEAVVDYIELPQKLTSENPGMLYVVVTKKNKVDETVLWINACGIKVKSIDICQSALRHIALQLENAEEGQALLHLEEEKSHLLIFKNKTLYMMRDLDVGLRVLRDTPDEKLKESSIYQDFSIEIQRSFDYCASKLQNANVSRLLITPLEEKRPGLLSNLSNILGLPVREISFDEFLKIDEEYLPLKEGESAFAIGAALNQ